jgi:lipid II:glycine glycyltransferase (peptidoglycan interpeptide bridge formation enzyme)
MITREVAEEEKILYNSLVNHPLQSWEWGEFRKALGQKIIRLGVFDPSTSAKQAKLKMGYQFFLHPVPKTKYFVIYFPKGPLPDKPMLESLRKLAKQEKAIFVKMEPHVGGPVNHEINVSGNRDIKNFLLDNGCLEGRPNFPRWTFWLDLKKTEEELLAAMHPKTRYNLRLAQKYGVTVTENNSDQAFTTHLQLLFETTKRQGFYVHTPEYHQKMWQTLKQNKFASGQALTAHLLVAKYQNKPLVTWVLFVFNKVLYYPYGGSSREFREVMPSNAMMWEAIKFGKKMGCQTFDLWGTPGPDPSPKDPWFGFHRFKLGFGPQLVEFIGTYDLIIEPLPYRLFNLADSLRWKFLRIKARLPL